MQNPKCIEKIAAHYLSRNFSEASAVVTPNKTIIALMSERKDIFSSKKTGGNACRRKLCFYEQDDNGVDLKTSATMKRRKEFLGVLALYLRIAESKIGLELIFLTKRAE